MDRNRVYGVDFSCQGNCCQVTVVGGAFRSRGWNRTSIFVVFKFIMSYYHFQKSAVEFYCMCSDDCHVFRRLNTDLRSDRSSYSLVHERFLDLPLNNRL